MQQMPPPYAPQAPTPKKKTNTALLAVGVGCGGLFLLSGIAAVVGVFWVKSKVTDAVGSVEEIAAQEQRIQALDEKYPFTPPAEGKPLRLDEKRLQDYLAIRSSLVPVFQAFEAKSKELSARTDNKGIGAGLEAIGMTGELIRDVRERFAKELDAKRMSAKEFHTITGTIYASMIGKGMAALQDGQREALEKLQKSFDQQLASKTLPAEARKMIEQQRETVTKQLAELPSHAIAEADKPIYDANTTLIAKYKAQIDKEANPALDALLFGETGQIENAFKPLGAMGKPAK